MMEKGQSIFEGSYRGLSRLESIHFPAKSHADADRLFRAFCAARSVKYVRCIQWLIDLTPFEKMEPGSMPVDHIAEQMSAEEFRQASTAGSGF